MTLYPLPPITLQFALPGGGAAILGIPGATVHLVGTDLCPPIDLSTIMIDRPEGRRSVLADLQDPNHYPYSDVRPIPIYVSVDPLPAGGQLHWKATVGTNVFEGVLTRDTPGQAFVIFLGDVAVESDYGLLRRKIGEAMK